MNMPRNISNVKQTLFLCILLVGCTAPQTRTPTIDNDNAEIETKKQQTLVVEDYVDSYKKLQLVTSRIITNGVDLCGDKVGSYYGFTWWNQNSLGDSLKEASKSRYNLGEAFTILSVPVGSPANKADIREGDVIVLLNDWLVPLGKDSDRQLNQKYIDYSKNLAPIALTVLRDGANFKATITPVKACDFKVSLVPDDVKNAYADGKNIVVYKGMMDFFKSDDEIALVVSHELAHNAMKHIDAQQKNAMVGGLLGLLLDIAAATAGVNTNGDFSRLGSGLTGNAYSVEFEQEADYVGLYFMKRANYDIDNAAAFWRRMAVTNSQAITMKSSHPTTPQRFVAIETAVEEINAKVAKGEPLTPELKTKNKPVQPEANPDALPEIAPETITEPSPI